MLHCPRTSMTMTLELLIGLLPPLPSKGDRDRATSSFGGLLGLGGLLGAWVYCRPRKKLPIFASRSPAIGR